MLLEVKLPGVEPSQLDVPLQRSWHILQHLPNKQIFELEGAK